MGAKKTHFVDHFCRFSKKFKTISTLSIFTQEANQNNEMKWNNRREILPPSRMKTPNRLSQMSQGAPALEVETISPVYQILIVDCAPNHRVLVPVLWRVQGCDASLSLWSPGPLQALQKSRNFTFEHPIYMYDPNIEPKLVNTEKDSIVNI